MFGGVLKIHNLIIIIMIIPSTYNNSYHCRIHTRIRFSLWNMKIEVPDPIEPSSMKQAHSRERYPCAVRSS
ncbi:unnamed protein product [Trichogramma brassicae]|uniref:Uncharacterized protein n=1 Tax=Trichogramma brassicae TaxID=86971 RepID=A0A6H5IDZ2_9HYME|nr:unnamed protein product [Trichogramma brassicae]